MATGCSCNTFALSAAFHHIFTSGKIENTLRLLHKCELVPGYKTCCYFTISINSAGHVTCYMSAEILKSAHGGNHRYIHFFSADFYDFFAIFKAFFCNFFLWFWHLAKMTVTTITFRRFWSGCYVLLPN